jgi:hypothetical protein
MRKLEGRWIFLSVLAVVVGTLVALAIWAFAIRDGDDSAGPVGAAAPLTQAERDSLRRLHLLATTPGIAFPAEDLEAACAEVTALVETKPFGPFDTSAYPGGSAAIALSPLPGTAHWAAASDVERLADAGWLLRQVVLRTLTRGDGSELASAVARCESRLRPALEAATA